MRQHVFVFSLFLCLSFNIEAQPSDSLLFVFWNIENMFDTNPDNGGEDFSPKAVRHWTAKRFRTKALAIAKTMLWVADKFGRLPDLIGLAEVENRSVVRSILWQTPLSEYGYGYLHYDSQDSRGIDVSLLYHKESVQIDTSFNVRPEVGNTRDILCADLSQGIRVAVNHFPSKYGGLEQTRSARLSVMGTLLKCIEKGPFVAMGDFNDGVDSEMFLLSDSLLVNKAKAVSCPSKGTIKHNGQWETIDMFLVSQDLDTLSKMYILEPDFLLMRDKSNAGLKPRRTYTGPLYNAGVSDHLPVCLRIKEK